MSIAVIDLNDIAVTPVFKIMEIENIPKSETAGHAVMEMHEVVEVRFAGSKNYSPIFPANAMWRREGNQVTSYAERWAEQYRAFKEGNPQEAMGTPLEMLRPFGVTPEQLSQCRALRIYSIEALHHLEGPAVKTLGMNANALKSAASQFMADRTKGSDNFNELEALRAEIAELRARSTIPPVVDLSPAEVADVLEHANAVAQVEVASETDDQIKERIAGITGSRPKGNPSRATLDQMLRELTQA